MEATITIISELTQALPAEFSFSVEFSFPELSVSTWSMNRNSPRLLMGLLALKAPSMVLLIRKIGTGGTVGWSPINVGSLSVPESYGGNIMTSQVFRHWPLSQRSWLSIPTNQSGDGASILIRDTLEKLEVTLTGIPVLSSTAPRPYPGRMSCHTFPADFWASISALSVPVWP